MVTVRLAAPGEAAALHAIAREAYQRYVPRIGREPAPMSADYAAAVGAGQAWVAVGRGQVIGFVALIAQPGHLLVRDLAVLPPWQGRGVGSRLLALAEEVAGRLRLAVWQSLPPGWLAMTWRKRPSAWTSAAGPPSR